MGLTADGTDGMPVLLYEDWHEYAVDLATMPGDPSDTNTPNLGWSALPFVTSLKIDPSEVQVSSEFAFDSIGLHADNCTAARYTVSWELVAPDSSGLTVDLFADADARGADGVHLAGPLPVSTGTGSAEVDLGALAPGSYYIYARVADTRHTRVYYSRVPVITPCADFAPPALVPQTGSWNQIADGYHTSSVGTPALATFPTLTGGARISARIAPTPRAALTALLFAYKGPNDFSYVDVDTRRGRVTAFRRSGGKRKRLRSARTWLVHTKRGTPPVTLTLRVQGGEVELAAKGGIALRLSGIDTTGAVGFGLLHRSAADLTRVRGAAL